MWRIIIMNNVVVERRPAIKSRDNSIRRKTTVTMFQSCFTDFNHSLKHFFSFYHLVLHKLHQWHPLENTKAVTYHLGWRTNDPVFNVIFVIWLQESNTFAGLISRLSMMILWESGFYIEMKKRSDFSNATLCACLRAITPRNALST